MRDLKMFILNPFIIATILMVLATGLIAGLNEKKTVEMEPQNSQTVIDLNK